MKECLNTMNNQSFNHKKLNSLNLSLKLQIIGSIKYDQNTTNQNTYSNTIETNCNHPNKPTHFDPITMRV